LPRDLQDEAEALTRALLDIAKPFARICKSSILATDADLRDLLMHVKIMRSALHLRDYIYREGDAIHDEGEVLGFRQSSQEERSPLTPDKSCSQFSKSLIGLERILQICDDSSGNPSPDQHRQTSANRYRPNTAFIMMWMDKEDPSLDDVLDSIKEAFGEFGIKALRADDIEHEEVITQRVIEEIRTSEFLFADLTGTRPNVYYEVGFAHALGKRVILFRKKDTKVHFDLAGYNCPEYRNLGDLKEQLRKRLATLTNKSI
jgi:hypothetical protein